MIRICDKKMPGTSWFSLAHCMCHSLKGHIIKGVHESAYHIFTVMKHHDRTGSAALSQAPALPWLTWFWVFEIRFHCMSVYFVKITILFLICTKRSEPEEENPALIALPLVAAQSHSYWRIWHCYAGSCLAVHASLTHTHTHTHICLAGHPCVMSVSLVWFSV